MGNLFGHPQRDPEDNLCECLGNAKFSKFVIRNLIFSIVYIYMFVHII